MNTQGQIWYERALFYGQKGDKINAARAYAIALRHDPHLPALPRFRNHSLLKSLERICLGAALVFLCWLLYLLFLGPAAVVRLDFPWRMELFTGVTTDGQVAAAYSSNPAAGESSGDGSDTTSMLIDVWQPEPSAAIAENPRYAGSGATQVHAGPTGFGPYEAYALLRNALYCYARDQGHFPAQLENLVQARYLERIPTDPLTGNRAVHSQFSNTGGWVYLQPLSYAAPKLREQVEMALYINHPAAPLTSFVPRSLQIDPVGPTLTLLEGLTPLKTWPASLGSAETPTPAGEYLVVDKQVLDNTANANPFGTRWLKLGEQYPYGPDGKRNLTAPDHLSSRGIGIHGTNLPDSLGQFTTSGCIRLYNTDVEELYQHIPNGIAITINPSR